MLPTPCFPFRLPLPLGVLADLTLTGATLFAQVRVNQSLRSLDIRNNPVDDNALWVVGGLLLDDDCQSCIGALSCYAFDITEDATILSLCDTALAVGAARLLLGVMKFNATITDLNLSGSGLVLQTATALAKAIRTNTTLKVLDLSRNPLSDATKYSETELEWSGSPFRQLASALQASVSLKILNLSGDEPLPLAQIKGQSGMNASSTNLRVLDLSNKGLDLLSGIIIGAIISAHTALTELSLHSNAALGPDGSRAIVERMPLKLKTMDLNSVITPLGATPKIKVQVAALDRLGVALGRLTALEKLTLDKNGLVQFNDARKLVELKTLTLNNNRIEALPDLSLLKQLKKLAVRANRLLELPANIGHRSRLNLML